MTGRSGVVKLALFAWLALLAACVQGGPGFGPAGKGPEAELARQARAMQRTVWEGAATGAVLGGVGAVIFGGDSEDVIKGAVAGGVAGAAAGTYVGYLQQQYATNEDRLERLRADIERANADTEATLRTMRAVLDQNRRALAAARADPGRDLPAAQQAAERDLANMQLATAGAGRWLDDFQSTRSLGLAGGVERQINELSRHISDMRAVTRMMAAEV